MKIINYQVKLRKIFIPLELTEVMFLGSHVLKGKYYKTRRKLQKYAREIDEKDSKSKGGVDDDIRY